MTLTLLVVAALAALNPFRVARVAPLEPQRRRHAAMLGGATSLVVVAAAAALSGPVVDALSISGSSTRIAAGVALVLSSLRDLIAPDPAPEPALSGALAGFVPVAFPTLLSPAVVLLALSAGHERGLMVAVAGLVLGLGIATAAVAMGSRSNHRSASRAYAVAGGAVGTLVILDGVYAI